MTNFIDNLNNWIKEQVVFIHEEKYFPYIMGGLFLLGIVTKWMVMRYYGRLNKKAEHMDNPKSAILRQIKMKFEGIKQVNGTVVSPVMLVKRHLSKCRIGLITVKRLNYFINICSIGAIFVGGVMGIEIYALGYGQSTALTYIVTGGIFAFILEIVDRNVHVQEMREELACTIVDFMENTVIAREQKKIEAMTEQKESVIEENDKKHQEEEIINQVIGEFLQ